MTKISIPEEILYIAEELRKAGYEAYLVGGCVRDLLMAKFGLSKVENPKDWDIATDARPEEIQKVFPDSVYENQFGTVAVKTRTKRDKTRKGIEKIQRESATGSNLSVIEITTFRLEGKYTDKRHPDEIKFAKTIEDDLSRRDFAINAMALKIQNSKTKDKNDSAKFKNFNLIDPFGGKDDLQNKIIRAVGDPEERFSEDALRLMRAVRFAVQLDFYIEEKTAAAIRKHSPLLKIIAQERIRDEFIKTIMTPRAKKGVELLEELGLLQYIMPELREGIGVGQNKHHIYNVWEHNLRALDYAAQKNYPLEIRLASLLHDVGKPRTKGGDGPDCTFYNHEVVGAKMTARIMERLHFPKIIAEKVVHLVRFHLFYYNVGEVTEAGVRRFIRRVGVESIDDLLKVREADRIGSGVPKAFPYKLRHLKFMIEKVRRDPISPKMLAVKGDRVMEILGIEPGPMVGRVLSVLLDEVLDNPQKNEKSYLEARIRELGSLPEDKLEKLSKSARERKEEFESGVEEEMKKKYYVK